jgi:hypothetical protein
MKISEMTDVQKETVLNALVQQEVYFANNDSKEWPSLFSNIIMTRMKGLDSATKFYTSLTDKQIERRFAIQVWESEAWNIYDGLMGYSLNPLSKSIDPRLWAKKEMQNVELLLNEGKNQLMTSRTGFCSEAIPELYNQLIIGEWKDFISIDELDRFHEAESKYLKDNGIDLSDSTSRTHIDINIFMAMPQKEHFLSRDYIAAQTIQALIWYKEFLTEVMRDGITFFDDDHGQQNKSKRKYIDIKSPQRSNDGFEAIKDGFDDFVTAKDRIPKWPELMPYLVMHPPQGFIIEGSYEKSKLIAIIIEGVDNPIDRDAFRNRFNRYFKKTYIKPDNS